MRKLGYTWSLMKASMGVLKQDKSLVLFALMSSVCLLVVLASFAVPVFMTESYSLPDSESSFGEQAIYYGLLFLFYFCNYFIIVFFNSAIISCAIVRMKGGTPSLSDGFQASMSRLPYIAGWALLSATVGLVLRIIEDRSEKAGRFIAGLLGMAWSIMTFLAVPVLVVEKKGPFEAVRESTRLLKKTWGEQLISNFGFGLMFFLFSIPGIILIVLGLMRGTSAVMFICISAAVLYFILLGLVQSTLAAIFQSALYLYAKDERIEGGFDETVLNGAMKNR